MGRFDDKVALVTGAASGMGRATCIRLAAEGASIFGLDVDKEGLQTLSEEIAKEGGEVATRVCDVSQRAQCIEAVEAVITTFGHLDVLANIAGIVRFSHSPDMSEEEWQLVLGVNLSGPFYLCQAAIPHLLESHGNIVNVASNAGLQGQSFTAAYCASKGGLVTLTKSLAMEYLRKPIRINCVCPAGTDTAMNRSIDFPEDLDWDLIKRFMGNRGFAAPEDLASAIAYLASDEAKSVHGAIFSVDNGLMAG